MVQHFYINPLSINGQCHTYAECGKLLSQFLEMADYCKGPVSTGQLKIYYDPRLEQRSLKNGEEISKTIGNIPPGLAGPDLSRRWYIFTRKSEKLCRQSGVDISVHCNAAKKAIVSGEVHKKLPEKNNQWISLSGDPVFDEGALQATPQGKQSVSIKNASLLSSLSDWLPKYESNPKHRKEDYVINGNVVSAMPLDAEEAQRTLSLSVDANGSSDRWSRHDDRQEYYRFKLTHPGKNIFHGFRVQESDLPADVEKKLW